MKGRKTHVLGTHIVQADSGYNSDSESWRRAYSAGRFRLQLRFWESAPVGAKCIMQADSGYDSDSESQRQSAQSV
jgi:hypothetical protein